ncbi:UDP-N-acetylmuramoylalanyl-D-glutamate--2,6-diaminopimelate ligase [Gracilibacillus ureilyticus]|uniref:UDP-N-acetylmuramoyl-L-alanyl-D-glutamate--2,6-diaminopimelate ligase n=1 Tax=Gracilibacillus ureilyticus TaxID=531814 RepID=A0A1H9TW86_9BACI|nr:UDP-N-acetylmuramoyl-L-alanyl-D-glutamate--2,6-diaminopimelate ligase [Gracilibacillus ureilyticus]SES01268.1 UDP-N-acetylmuramoylalanyl-D-glutamate--2,6-diaminopimelate ligase [Gracilibacillus ureilyticus]
MKLRQLAELLLVKCTMGNMETEITGIQMDSRKIEKGNLFICVPEIKGFLKDRHSYAEDAVKNGAVALVLERDVEIDVPKIFVNDARYAMSIISSHFFTYPSNELQLIGITGTNGKTTTSYIIEKILSDYGYQTGLMGNNGVKMNDNLYPTDINTQESPILQKNLRKMSDSLTDYCVMEVTSQGLDMKRVLGCNFKTAIFTNLTQDHLDYHGTFENYRNTKGLLFSNLGSSFNHNERKFAVLNADDATFHYFKKVAAAEVITYGVKSNADVIARNINMTSNGTNFDVTSFKGDINMDIQLVGIFNVYNALASITATLIEGIPLTSIKESLASLTSIDGRMEIVDEGQEFSILVDYAHTPDALENVLKSIMDFSNGRVITVFGCGGDRDKKKRSIMGQIASSYSDIVIVTSDNPRSEEPTSILKDIEKGINQSKLMEYKIIEDREEAIYEAVKTAARDDIVLIAGKGHETYQILNDKTIYFDDKEIVKKAISG